MGYSHIAYIVFSYASRKAVELCNVISTSSNYITYYNLYHKLCQVGVGLNIAQNHSSCLWEVIFGHYLSQLICKFDQK